MYWPLGAPRVYAASKSKRKSFSENDDKAISEAHLAHEDGATLLGLRVSRSGQMFATITSETLIIWQTSPAVALASVTRSPQQIRQYGPNVSVLLKPDASIAVVQTARGYLVTYSISVNPEARVYRQQRENGHIRRQSTGGQLLGEVERAGFREVSIQFRVVIQIDAGIGKALALDEELVVATEKPAAIQCIRWTPDGNGKQTSTELLNRMPWISKKTNVVDMVYDKPLSLSVWIISDGGAYAVQRLTGFPKESDTSKRLFHGYGFHKPSSENDIAIKVAINARFSLLAVACSDGEVFVYTARDYVGSIPLSHKHHSDFSIASTGNVTSLAYSPDGYCLFVGYERGWNTWSVYGKLGGTSFVSDRSVSESNAEGWLLSVHDASWISGGSEILFTGQKDDRLWMLEMVRSAATGCFSSSNISRILLQSPSNLILYRGYELPDVTSISGDPSLWHRVQISTSYLMRQRPIRSTIISHDGRYIAVAGHRGLAHVSINSGRWKTFEDVNAENAFMVRGGMCWYQHILIAAVEASDQYELRLFSRELALDDTSLVYVESLPAPCVLISPTGEDSLLVYTYENILYHYIVTTSPDGVRLAQVGQIAFNGIIRAPARVRAISWILPEYQLRDGDPSQDVQFASVLFLIDAKLVVLQPCTAENGTRKYEMRIIASSVEYYALARDQSSLLKSSSASTPRSSPVLNRTNEYGVGQGLKDSLWFFDGSQMQCWTDVQDVIRGLSTDIERHQPSLISVEVDFYPLSIFLNKGLTLGIESELVQRRDAHFAFFRFATRTQLVIPPILSHHLTRLDTPTALSFAHQYQHLSYFSHALEILLHSTLDAEVDKELSTDDAILPTVLSFLSSFPDYLDILVQCTRKTELRSWRTLFAHLPSPQELFEKSLQQGMLKTAGGYLLVLQTFDELGSSSKQAVRLLRRAKEAEDWELCKELARFLRALDESGDTLRAALEQIDRASPEDQVNKSSTTLNAPLSGLSGLKRGESSDSRSSLSASGSGGTEKSDYFQTQGP